MGDRGGQPRDFRRLAAECRLRVAVGRTARFTEQLLQRRHHAARAEEHVAAAHVLLELHVQLAIREALDSIEAALPRLLETFATGLDLAQACRAAYRPPVRFALVGERA